ncbi:MAG: hypothetical protein ACSHW5_04355 [Polaribacter sp.]
MKDAILKLRKQTNEQSIKAQHRVKKIAKFIASPKAVAFLLTSDFPVENPREQNRNFSYTNPLQTLKNENYIIFFGKFFSNFMVWNKILLEIKKSMEKDFFIFFIVTSTSYSFNFIFLLFMYKYV